MGAGAPVLWGGSLPPSVTGPELLREIYDAGVGAGFNVVRILAHGVSKETALQTAPGVYSEAAFKGLDYAVAEAGARGLRLILALSSNWGDVGSVDQFVDWSATATTHDDFFTDAAAEKLFLEHASKVLGRVNSITGVAYKDDPTIFAINLINEPRCYRCGGAIRDWVASVAPAVKALAPKLLLTIGEEGFYGRGSPAAASNPGGADSWAGDEGQDFVADHSVNGIDFWAIHMWPGTKKIGGEREEEGGRARGGVGHQSGGERERGRESEKSRARALVRVGPLSNLIHIHLSLSVLNSLSLSLSLSLSFTST